ncbi:TIGR04282 family arsenosugar biosynthesis glycosyltransferase [Pseudanabaena sp. FACHB-2040]|uniref:TIGR04282 family arsenosugar biosynthesis glycosyltransferase n=1 Tax=Pseudanabaena sp. FACHB-2040 TaxID=2692859 RepID=UPI001F551E26|nr:TIGR04282 family arsenosugar biosynthesis glycosyltransferase [Pseudanabaena sp. FACHB-2040]
MLLTRYPQPGKTKTRLIPHLGPEGAAQIQRLMTEHLIRQGLELRRHHSLGFEVHFTGSSLHQIRSWLGHELTYRPQCEGDLGQRLTFAFHQGFTAGRARLLAIGSDCPAIGDTQVTAAFRLLRQHDLVLGPALDGGYYLIGLRRTIPELFKGISWGSDRVLGETVAIASHLNLSTAFLDPLPDIDRPEDLPIWEKIWAGSGTKVLV